MATRGSYVHNSMVDFSGASRKCWFYAIFSKYWWFQTKLFTRLLELIHVQLYKQNPVEKFLIFTIYQNYTMALIILVCLRTRHHQLWRNSSWLAQQEPVLDRRWFQDHQRGSAGWIHEETAPAGGLHASQSHRGGSTWWVGLEIDDELCLYMYMSVCVFAGGPIRRLLQEENLYSSQSHCGGSSRLVRIGISAGMIFCRFIYIYI